MNNENNRFGAKAGFFAFLIACVVILGVLAVPATAAESNKWRIQVSEGATSDGEIAFQIAPKGGAAIDVVVPVTDGTAENAVAERIATALRSSLAAATYTVETDDGEDVLVKKVGNAPDFDLRVVSNTVKSVRINLDQE